MKILLCQINTCVGNLAYNSEKIITQYQACDDDVDLMVFPELALTGYPLHDFVADNDFLSDIMNHIDSIASATRVKKTAILFGTPYLYEENIYNAALCVRSGEITDKIFKHHLPNYGVFNEARNFVSANQQQLIELNGKKIGVLICEDMWVFNTARYYLAQGADIAVVINASPYDTTKQHMRLIKAQEIVTACRLPLAYVNLYGGQDDLVFDGGTFVLGLDNQYVLPPQSWQEGCFSYCTSTQKISGAL